MAVNRLQQSGFGFPLMRHGVLNGPLRFINNDTLTLIKESIYEILMTAPGERLYNPQWGCGAKLLLFEPSSNANMETMQSLVYSALIQWEPRITLSPEDVTVSPAYTPQDSYVINVNYTVKAPGLVNSQQNVSVTY